MTRIVDWAVHNTRVVIALIAGRPHRRRHRLHVDSEGSRSRHPDPDPDRAGDLSRHQSGGQRAASGQAARDQPALGRGPEDDHRARLFRRRRGHPRIRRQLQEAEGARGRARAVDETRSLLPAEADPPTVKEVNIALQPVISVALSGDVPDRTLLQLARDLQGRAQDDSFRARGRHRRRAQGDAGNRHRSGKARKLRHHAAGDVQCRFEQQPADCGGLDRHRPWQLRGQGSRRHRKAATICSICRSARPATRPSRLSDVAQVRRTFYDPTTYARVNGQPTISLDVSKRIGSNIIANNQAVRDIVDKAAEDLARRRACHLPVRRVHRHPRPAGFAVGLDHSGHHPGDDHHRGGAGPALRPARRRRDSDLVPHGVHDAERHRADAELHDHVRHAARSRHSGRRRDHRRGIRRPKNDRRPCAARGLCARRPCACSGRW